MKGCILEVSVMINNEDSEEELIKIISTFSLGDQFPKEGIEDYSIDKDTLIKKVREANFPEILAYLKLLPGIPVEGYHYNFTIKWK